MNNIKQSLKLMIQTKIANDNMIADANEKQLFSEAISDAIEALEKQIQKKPVVYIRPDDVKIGRFVFKAGTKVNYCSSCNSPVSYDRYCRQCGQALLFNERSKSYESTNC